MTTTAPPLGPRVLALAHYAARALLENVLTRHRATFQQSVTLRLVAEGWEGARMFFDAMDHAAAARVLGKLVEEVPEQTWPRLLLARAYYHSAQPRRVEAELRVLVESGPVEQYARLLGRSLQGQGRQEEAEPHMRLASAPAGDFERR